MFELLFKYPQAVFARGKLVLLSPWLLWLMSGATAVLDAAALEDTYGTINTR